MRAMHERHDGKVARVVQQLRAHAPGTPVSFRKKAVSHQVPKRRDRRHTDEKIDVTDLDAILSIDPDARTCVAEPGVTFTELVRATLPHGLVPTVVPELRTITIGGAVAGCSLESMSFRYGGFHDSCSEYEVVTAKGDVLRCAPDGDDKLLFEMMHGSFGTLGVLTKLKFRLVPAKPFVHVSYEKYATLEAYLGAIDRRHRARDVDFMDGIIHRPDLYVLSLGRFVASVPYTNRYDWLKVYYRTTARREEDYLETEDYFFRYDNGVTNPTPRSFLGRLFLGKILHSANLLRLAEKLRHVLDDDRPKMTLDTFVPFSKVPEFMRWYGETIGLFPLWCVPYHVPHRYEWIADAWLGDVKDDLFLDLAMYGFDQPKGRNLYRELEEELVQVRGIKTLIAYNYYDEETFWQIWNRRNYQAVKQTTDPDGIFRDLYEKTCRAARGIGP